MIFRTAMLTLATTAMIGAPAFAAQTGPLVPGKPAGVQEAQSSPTLLVTLGVAVVIIGAIAVASATADNTPCGSACNVTGNTGTSSTGTN